MSAVLPLQIRTLVVDAVADFDDLKRLSSCSTQWRAASARRLFAAIRIGSSYTHALLTRMRHFIPRHGAHVRTVTVDLSFAPHRGHRGCVRYDTRSAHVALGGALAAVVLSLSALTTVRVVFHDPAVAVVSDTYEPLVAALATLRRWRSLEVLGPVVPSARPLVEALQAVAVAAEAQCALHHAAFVAYLPGQGSFPLSPVNAVSNPHSQAADLVDNASGQLCFSNRCQLPTTGTLQHVPQMSQLCL